MVTLVVKYVFRPEATTDAEALLREAIVASRAEPGCRTYDVFRRADDVNAFMLYEQYDDDAALAAHRASDHFERFVKRGILTLAAARDAATYVPFT